MVRIRRPRMPGIQYNKFLNKLLIQNVDKPTLVRPGHDIIAHYVEKVTCKFIVYVYRKWPFIGIINSLTKSRDLSWDLSGFKKQLYFNKRWTWKFIIRPYIPILDQICFPPNTSGIFLSRGYNYSYKLPCVLQSLYIVLYFYNSHLVTVMKRDKA